MPLSQWRDRAGFTPDFPIKPYWAPENIVKVPRTEPGVKNHIRTGLGRLLVGFTPAGHMEQFFRELEKREQYFGNGTPEDREKARQEYGIVNVGPR